MAATKDNLFNQTKLSSQKKAENTHDAAMLVVHAEVAAREKKTAKLRKLRLEHEAANPVAEVAVKKGKAKKE